MDVNKATKQLKLDKVDPVNPVKSDKVDNAKPARVNEKAKRSKEGHKHRRIDQSIQHYVTLVIYKFINALVILFKGIGVLYQFLCMLYQYPNATSYVFEVTYNNFMILWRTGQYFKSKGAQTNNDAETTEKDSPNINSPAGSNLHSTKSIKTAPLVNKTTGTSKKSI